MNLFTVVGELSLTTWLVIILVLLLTKWYVSTEPWKNHPPGPPSIPILGSLPFLDAKDIFKSFANLTKKYGEIYTVFWGSERTVFLNGYAIIKEALVKQANAFAGRPNIFLLQEFTKGQGIASAEGKLWQEQRCYVLHVLKEMGMGKNTMEHIILDEATYLIEILEKNVNKPYDLQQVIQKAVSNVINVFAFGKSWNYDDPLYIKYLEATVEAFEILGNNNPLMIFPWLKYLPGDLFHYKKISSYFTMFDNQYIEWINDHKQKIDKGEIPTDFIGQYLIEMRKHKDEPDCTFSDHQLVRIMNELFAAGTDTSSNTLGWLFLHLIDQPDIQGKVHAEIDNIIGSKRLPTMQDRNKMPYTEAVLSEVQRIADLVPLSLPHATTEDVKLRGYDIPKGTIVMVNMSSVSNDPKLWQSQKHSDQKDSYMKMEVTGSGRKIFHSHWVKDPVWEKEWREWNFSFSLLVYSKSSNFACQKMKHNWTKKGCMELHIIHNHLRSF